MREREIMNRKRGERERERERSFLPSFFVAVALIRPLRRKARKKI